MKRFLVSRPYLRHSALLVPAESKEAAIAKVLNNSKRIEHHDEIDGGTCPVEEWLVCEWSRDDEAGAPPRLFEPEVEEEEITF
jgi:hypothetical protein